MPTVLNQVGDWNPQLFRELKGRLTRRSLVMTVLTAAIGQFLLFEVFLAEPEGLVNLFRTLNWLIPFLILLPGSWLLVSDIAKEEQRGTLNFIRLSPQSSSSILIGKLLGVPILVYLGLALILPLHLWVAIALAVPLWFLLSYYGLLAVAGYLVFSLALLCGFASKTTLSGNSNSYGSGLAALFVVLIGFGFVPTYMVWNLNTVWNFLSNYIVEYPDQASWQWFFLPISQNPLVGHSFTFATAGLAIAGVWQILTRYFHDPNITLLSKQQSFGFVACVNILPLGFFVQSPSPMGSEGYIGALAVLGTLNFVAVLGLIATLLPSRQALIDWARYRRERQDRPAEQRLAWLQDLVTNEKSPAFLAIALNLGIVAVILGLWILFWPSEQSKLLAFAGLALCLSLLAVYAAIAQFLLLLKTPQRALWVAATLGFMMIAPILVAAVTEGSLVETDSFLLFSPFLWLALPHMTVPTLLLSFLGQWGVVGLLNWRFLDQLRKLGASSSQSLLTGSSAQRLRSSS
jgi:hypothetical protein